MLTWFLFFSVSFYLLSEGSRKIPSLLRESSGAPVKAAELLFHELEETLASGVVPSDERWSKLRSLAAPWNELSYDCLIQLRSEGAAVVPTLKRFRELARRHFESLAESRARSSQALAQAAVCGFLVPIFSVLLRVLLPDVQDAGASWWFITALASCLGLLSGVWIWKMAEYARWGGLIPGEQSWMLDVMVFGERLLALMKLGRAPDRAWTESIALLPAPIIATWGADPWKSEAEQAAHVRGPKTLREALFHSGSSFKKSIQASLWDGQPCAERIESVLSGVRSEIRAYQEKELQLLSTRALKPLFLLTAPGLLALLGFALMLSVSSAVESL